ncbi:MFS transporter [Streptomyces cinnamoneus]|uniref:MFS transporter n=1 Tax=Streptomyces cinnamoneus TaxID=53446 RepID=A0A918TD54_STRCJ|nr:MFS transporter [Streptomyces cinnamoneus]GHC42181.1 MFS transporter [Streptomyces cinnamoneus]
MEEMIDTKRRHTALLVAGCFFMENLDGTIVSTAAPRMGDALGVAPAAIGLVVTAYLVTLAVLIPLSGWLTARFGARRVFLTAIAVFTLASLACALSTGLGMLVAMRVLQGAGGAMMVPVGRLVVVSGAEKTDMPRLISYVVWPALAAPVIAPLAGGLLTTYADWRWMFLVNLPLGAVAFAVAHRLIDAPSHTAAPPPRLDRWGVALVSTGLGALTWTAHLLSEAGADRAEVLLAGGAAVLLTAAAARHLLRTDQPLIDLRMLKVTTFRASVSGGSLFWVVVAAVPFLLPLLFQEAFGWSAIRSGAAVLFVFVGNIAIKPAANRLLDRFGFRPLLIAAALGVAVTTALCGFLTAATPVAVVLVLAVVAGAARSLGLTCYQVIAFADVPQERMRHANTLQSTAQQAAAGLGVAAATLALRAGGPLGAWLPGPATPATPYGVAFCLLALLSLGALAGALRLHPTAGDAVRSAPAAGGPGVPAPARARIRGRV